MKKGRLSTNGKVKDSSGSTGGHDAGQVDLPEGTVVAQRITCDGLPFVRADASTASANLKLGGDGEGGDGAISERLITSFPMPDPPHFRWW
jgi:hypothetical protein